MSLRASLMGAIAAVALLVSSPCSGDDWPQHRRDGSRSATSAEGGVINPLSEAWTADTPTGSGIVSSPVVAEGLVLIGSVDGRMRAYEEATGVLRWTYTASEPIVATPVVLRGRVYVVDRRGQLACLTLETGAEEWVQGLGGQGFSSPATDGNRLYLGTGFPKKTVSSVNLLTGAAIWDKQLTQPSFASPATDGASVWSVSNDGKLFRADASTGAQAWLDSTQGSPQGIPVLVDGGNLFFAPGGYDTSLYRIDAAGGMPAWNPRPLLFAGDPATQAQATCAERGSFTTQVVPNWRFVSSGALRVAGGTVLVEGGIVNLRLFAVDEGSGAIVWSLPAGVPDAGMPFASSPAYASGRVYVGGGGAGSLLVVNPVGGSIAQSIALPGFVASSPAIANGRVFVASSAGRLAAYDSAGNGPPGPVSSMSPSGGVVVTGPAVTLSWGTAADGGPNADPATALRYLVRWDDDGEVLKSSDAEVLTGPGVLSQATGAYPDDAVVTWRARTLDTQGAYSPWSPPASFTVYLPWRVQGRVTRNGVGVAGVTVTMTGSLTRTTVTDANGYFNFYGVPDGNYTLSFSKVGYAFSPSTIDVTVAGDHELGLDTTATYVPIFAIRGRVTVGTAGVGGVRIDVTGDATANATTDSNGVYAVPSLTIGSYTATPSGYGLAFTPTSRAAAIVDSDATGVDFAASRSGTREEEVVVGLGRGGSGNLQARGGLASGFPVLGWARLPFTTYDAAMGATHPSLGDMDGDGLDEIAVGIGTYRTSGGWVAIFDDGLAGHRFLRWYRLPFAAYDSANGETWPCCGNFDRDGRSELLIGTGTYRTNGGWMLMVDDLRANLAPLRWVRAGQAAYQMANGATYPAAGDVNGDGMDELVVGFGTGGQGYVSVLHASDGFRAQRFVQVPWADYDSRTGATRPACGNVDGDAREEVAVGLEGTVASGYWLLMDDEGARFARLAWGRVPWTAYDGAVGTTRPAMSDLDGDGRKEVVIGLGPYTASGGFLYAWDDFAAGLPVLGSWNVDWAAYSAMNGETFPTGGNTR